MVASGVLAAVTASAGQGEGGGFAAVSAFALAQSASGRSQPNECDIMVQLQNRQVETVDSLTLDVAVYLKGSARPEIRTVYFSTVAPSQKEAVLMTLSHRCPDVVRIVLQDGSNCRVAGKGVTDCLARIDTVGGSAAPIPVDK